MITLSISSSNIKDCYDIAKTMKKFLIESKITPNYSVNYKNNVYKIERGCSIEIYNIKPSQIKSKVWYPLQKKYNLDCAHLFIKNIYNGCINKFNNNLINEQMDLQ